MKFYNRFKKTDDVVRCACVSCGGADCRCGCIALNGPQGCSCGRRCGCPERCSCNDLGDSQIWLGTFREFGPI